MAIERRTRTAESGQCNWNEISNILVLIFDIIVVNIKFFLICLESLVRAFLPKEQSNVNGQVILITGTGHGIGRQLALQYGALGAKVLCWDINEKNNSDTVKEIKANGGQAHGYTCNVINRSDINELADKMKKEHGFVSIVVNNAGIMPCHPIMQQTESEIRNTFEINVMAHFWIMQAFLPDMIDRNQGHLVALSSCAGLFGLPNLVPYCGTKFAVRGYMQALGEELRRLNPNTQIKLTTIYPYMVDTGLCKKPRYRFPKLMRLVTPTEAADSIVLAQRTSMEEATIPRHYLYLEKIGRLLPKNAMRVVNDFLDTGVDSDL